MVVAISNFWLFVASSLLLAMTPGPDTLYIAGRSTALGVKAGTVAAIGVAAGIFVHTAAAAIGITALLVASAAAFSILKLVGAAYLVYVGISIIRSILHSSSNAATVIADEISLGSIFKQGFLTNLLNPKVALFFMAFLPHFVDSSGANQSMTLLFLGLVFNLVGTSWNLLVAWSAARFSKWLHRRRVFSSWFNVAIGSFFIFLGGRLMLESARGG